MVGHRGVEVRVVEQSRTAAALAPLAAAPIAAPIFSIRFSGVPSSSSSAAGAAAGAPTFLLLARRPKDSTRCFALMVSLPLPPPLPMPLLLLLLLLAFLLSSFSFFASAFSICARRLRAVS